MESINEISHNVSFFVKFQKPANPNHSHCFLSVRLRALSVSQQFMVLYIMSIPVFMLLPSQTFLSLLWYRFQYGCDCCDGTDKINCFFGNKTAITLRLRCKCVSKLWRRRLTTSCLSYRYLETEATTRRSLSEFWFRLMDYYKQPINLMYPFDFELTSKPTTNSSRVIATRREADECKSIANVYLRKHETGIWQIIYFDHYLRIWSKRLPSKIWVSN